MRIVVVALVVTLVLAIVMTEVVDRSLAQTPKESLSPRLYAQINDGAIAGLRSQMQALLLQHSEMLMEMRVQNQRITDMAQQIKEYRSELDKLDPSRESSRITALEDFVNEYRHDELESRASSDKFWSEAIATMRMILAALVGLAGNEIWKRYKDRRRRRLRDENVNAQLESIREGVDHATDSTNSKMDELLKLTATSSHAKGVLEEKTRREEDRNA